MVRQVYRVLLVIFMLTLSACNSAVARRVSSTSAAPSDDAFIEAVRQRIDQEKIVPEFGRLEIPPLFVNRRTFAFAEDEGTVLQLNLFGYPDPKGTDHLVTPLRDVTAQVSEQQAFSLDGLEIVFHRRDSYNPMQVWAARPPWGEAQTVQVPLTDEAVEAMRPAD